MCRSGSARKLETLMESVAADVSEGRPWVIQRASRHKEDTTVLSRSGGQHEERAYTKLSGFYGPEGLMGILVMQKRFTKVHGGSGTIMSIVY